jgi:hypothetical protein
MRVSAVSDRRGIPDVVNEIAPMNRRERAGLEMATRFRIEQDKSGYWIVPSETQVGKTYRVSPKGEDSVCTCKDFFARLKPCKHIHAVRFFLKGEVLTEEQEQERQKRPNYPQDWPSTPSSGSCWRTWSRI